MTFAEALLRKSVKYRQGGADRAKILLNCPFCPERGKGIDTQYRLCVHASQGWGRCLHCDWKRRWAVAAVLKQLGMLAEGVHLAQGVGEEGQPVAPVEIRLPADYQRLTHASDDLDRQALHYVLSRGITQEQIQQHRIGVSFSGRYAYRIIFPIYAEGVLRGFNARDFTGEQKPKYLLSSGDKYAYNLDPKATTVIFSEGVIKALRIARVANACSASLLGHHLTDVQLEQLKRSACRHAIIYPDAEFVGREGAAEIAAKLREGWKKKVSVVLAVKQPPDDAPLEIVRRHLIENITPYNRTSHNQLIRGR